MTITTLGALGIGGVDYFTTKPFIDWMKSADTRWNVSDTPPAYAGTDGWLHAMPNNSNDTTIIHASDSGTPYVNGGPTAPYTLKAAWNDPNITVTFVVGVGMSGEGSATPPSGYAFARKISIDSVSTSTTITLRMRNLSGSTLDSTAKTVSVYLATNEALFVAGEVFDPDFLASLVGAAVIRPMGWNRPNTMGHASPGDGDLTTIAFTDFNVESDRTWKYVPWTVYGKLGLKTGKDLWITVPPKCTDACVSSAASAMATYHQGLVYVEDGNETWNTASPFHLNRAWFLNTKSVGLTIVDSNGNSSSADQDKISCAMSECATRDWAAFEAVFGRSKIKRVLAGQSANYGNLTPAALEYTVANNPALAQYGAVKVKTIVDLGAVAPYFKARSGGADTSLKTLCDTKAYLSADSVWTTYFQDYITAVDVVGVNAWLSTSTGFLSKAPLAQITSYECGGEQIFALEAAAQMYSFTINVGDNTMLSASDISASFDNGEQVRRSFFATEPASVNAGSIAGKPVWYVKKNGTTKLEFYSDSALTSRVTLDGDTGITWTFDNITRAQLLDTYIKNYLDGALGRTLYEYYFAQAFNGKLTLFNQFVNCGPYAIGSQFGLKKSQWIADTPRAVWFRGLAVSSGLQDKHDGDIYRWNKARKQPPVDYSQRIKERAELRALLASLIAGPVTEAIVEKAAEKLTVIDEVEGDEHFRQWLKELDVQITKKIESEKEHDIVAILYLSTL